MKLEEAKSAIAALVKLKDEGKRGELANIRRGMSAAHDIITFGVLSRYVKPYDEIQMDAAAVVCGACAADKCAVGTLSFAAAVAIREKDTGEMRRLNRLLSACSTEEVTEVLRYLVRYVISREHEPINWAQLLADAVNFDIAADDIRTRWALEASRVIHRRKEGKE